MEDQSETEKAPAAAPAAVDKENTGSGGGGGLVVKVHTAQDGLPWSCKVCSKKNGGLTNKVCLKSLILNTIYIVNMHAHPIEQY